MRKTLLHFALLFSALTYGQIPIRLLSKETNKPVAYANVWKDNGIFVSSDSLGVFHLYESQLQSVYKITAIGYETIDNVAIPDNRTIFLEPMTIPLNDVILSQKTNKKKFKLGKLKGSDAVMASTMDKIVSISGKYFPNDFSEPIFLDKIKFNAYASKKNVTLAVSLFSVGDQGQPGEPIYYGNIIRQLKKGRHAVEIDLKNVNIPLPEKGVFVMINYLQLEQNRVYGQHNKDWYFLEPLIDLIKIENEPDQWSYGKTGWQKNKLYTIAMQLTVTN